MTEQNGLYRSEVAEKVYPSEVVIDMEMSATQDLPSNAFKLANLAPLGGVQERTMQETGSYSATTNPAESGANISEQKRGEGMVFSTSHKSVTFDEQPPSVHEYSVVLEPSAESDNNMCVDSDGGISWDGYNLRGVNTSSELSSKFSMESGQVLSQMHGNIVISGELDHESSSSSAYAQDDLSLGIEKLRLKRVIHTIESPASRIDKGSYSDSQTARPNLASHKKENLEFETSTHSAIFRIRPTSPMTPPTSAARIMSQEQSTLTSEKAYLTNSQELSQLQKSYATNIPTASSLQDIHSKFASSRNSEDFDNSLTSQLPNFSSSPHQNISMGDMRFMGETKDKSRMLNVCSAAATIEDKYTTEYSGRSSPLDSLQGGYRGEASVEDLAIPNELSRSDTLKTLEQSTFSESSSTLTRPQLPPLDPNLFRRLEINDADGTVHLYRQQSSSSSSYGDDINNDDDYYDGDDRQIDADLKKSPGKLSSENSVNRSKDSLKSQSYKKGQLELPVIEFSNENGEIIVESSEDKRATVSDTNDGETIQNESQSSADDDDALASVHDSSPVLKLPPDLPTLPRYESFFDDTYPFGFDSDKSAGSITIGNPPRPDNYLSIWHAQENQLNHINADKGPIFQCRRIAHDNEANKTAKKSLESTPPVSIRDKKFKFKPKIVTRPTIYYSREQWQNLQEASPFYSYEEVGIQETPSLKQLNKSILDPLRRNSIVSKKIQQELKTSERINAYYFNRKSSIRNSHRRGIRSSSSGGMSDSFFKENTDDSTETMNQEFLPKLVSGKNEFANLIEGFVNNENSQVNTSGSTDVVAGNRDSKIFKLWEHSDHENTIFDYINSQKVTNNVIDKLLYRSDVVKEEDENKVIGIGIIKNTKKDTKVDAKKIESIYGFEAVHSNSLGSFKTIEGSLTPVKEQFENTNPSSLSHIKSSSKNVRVSMPYNIYSTEPGSPQSLGRNNTVRSSKSKAVARFDRQSNKHGSMLIGGNNRDRGQLYIELSDINNLKLSDIEQHKTEYAIEFDNGMNVIQTEWTKLPNDGRIELGHEYSVVVDHSLEVSLIITLKCRFEKPKQELVEVIERVPIKNKCKIFGKSKYKYVKTYVNRDSEYDSWEYKFAQDGSFARCKIHLNEEELGKLEYKKQDSEWTLKNEWQREVKPSKNISARGVWELPRVAPYPVGIINMTMCYLPRISPLEKFPKSLKVAEDIVEGYKQQQTIQYEGYMWQEGGDTDVLKRRYFKLNGTRLVAHHEVTRRPRALMNMLKVVRLVNHGSSRELVDVKKRFITDLVLLNECFKLHFENGEEILFNPDTRVEKLEWVEKLTAVIKLNRFHQPWVKKLLAESVAETSNNVT
ncbi:Bud4p Ecym_7154 [Eremothecium cymbalariae DBVPG|uniref:PH domain-containing protein n=1 Tax=Eremothecium cymbalariae (strain CBS 270.75 / DBVPG 7215 / KCTC 17166 / NRRL Y-17582) TaxID=931890 RepID=G8JVY7_ERECY|nr:hypothetical protein Ecym_7154 [Eremothecium cymbalariae DBVPG\